MVGQAVCRRLAKMDGIEIIVRTRRELDLTDELATASFFAEETPEAVIFAAAKVGGIHANQTYPVEFMVDNVKMAMNSITSAYENGVERFLFLGSSCIYPRMAPQPILEDALLSSSLELTNEAYALAKITGLKLCQYYRKQYGALYHSAMPTNLYGPGDNYHPDHSHVLPAMIRRFHNAKENNDASVTIWGTGAPLREFLHVDDLAAGVIHLLGLDNPPDWVNIGSGIDQTIFELAKLVALTVGFTGQILLDPSKPDGTPRKLMDSSLLRSTGWSPRIQLADGLGTTYQDFLEQHAAGLLRAV